MIVAPVHTRKKGGAFGTKKEAAVRFVLSVPFWCIAVFLLLFIFKLPNKNAVSLVLIDIIFWIPFCILFTFYFLTVKNGGELLLEDYIRFKNGVIGNNHSFFYSDVKYIYIGTCPLPLTMWSYLKNAHYKAILEKDWGKYYGEKYIIAEDENHSPIFACDYSPAVMKVLKDRCTDAEMF